MNLLFSQKSVKARGSLYHIKNNFGHRTVKKNVMENFSSVAEFIRFATHGYIALGVMKKLDMTELEVSRSKSI